MTKSEFEEKIKRNLEESGYTKVKTELALFGLKAKVSAKDHKGKKRKFKAEMVKRKGKELVAIVPEEDELKWIDEFEAMDALFYD